MSERFLGVTVMPEYIQTEGIDGVLANLRRVGATAVATSPYVMEPADESSGSREPPADAGAGGVRILDRPLWGRRELFVRTSPSFEPERSLYSGLAYQPTEPDELTRGQGHVIGEFVAAAKSSGLRVYLQVQAAIPPGYRVQFGGPTDEDQPRLPDGRVPPNRVAKNGSLASPAILGYAQALTRDLLRAYPDIDGIRHDWPEYPPYSLDDIFVDFGDHARSATGQLGFDFERFGDVGSLYEALSAGAWGDEELRPWVDPDGGRFRLLRWLSEWPGVADWLRFKAVLVEEFLAGLRGAVTDGGGAGKELVPSAFPPPFSLVSGMDYARAGRHVDGIVVKLYSMHWPMMLRGYGEALLARNSRRDEVSEALLVRALARVLDIADDDGLSTLEGYHYPAPEEAHPVGSRAMARKIEQARREAGETPIFAFAHGYGPVEDFERRLRVAWEASGGRVWVNRYGYLGDEKLAVMAKLA